MAPSFQQSRTTPPNGNPAFTGSLRFELVDEEERALFGSYAVAGLLGLVFLLLVQFGPRTPVLPVVEPIKFRDLPIVPIPEPIKRLNKGSSTGSAATRGASSARPADIGSAFDGAGRVGQPMNILGAVAIARPGEPNATTGGKTVLAFGEGGVGSTTPDRGGIGSGAGAGGEIGGVRAGGSVSRTAEQIAPPAAVPVAPITAAGDAATVGTFVRGHESQLRFCYQESGLRINPALAGLVTVAIDVAANGSVSSANVTRRTWSGAGAAEAEACILRAIRGWRLPASGGVAATYSFPFNFSR
jgi:hypothetical protein